MRIMVELPNDSAELRAAYAAREPGDLARIVGQQFGVGIEPIQIVGRPSFRFKPAALEPDVRPDPETGRLPPDEAEIRAALPSLIVAVRVDNEQEARRYIDAFRSFRGKDIGAGASPPISQAGHWVPNRDRPPIFGTRAAAEALVNAKALRDRGLVGTRTNLVLFDEGANFKALAVRAPRKPLRLAGGWPVLDGGALRKPGKARPDGHGTMVGLNAVALARDARLWDLPFLPERILGPIAFADDAAAALQWVDTEIRLWLGRAFPGPWVFCHAWGIYDRRLELPRGGYTSNPANPLNRIVRELDERRRDQIFGAGNGGQFAPHPLCGPDDIGPGRSILGANSSRPVLTTGAVRADGMWIGYSSQGPGQRAFGDGEGPVEKPDLCAPSHFVEDSDGAWLSSGTSAACGVAAGAVAALRSATSPLADVACEEVRRILRQAARKPPRMRPGAGYDIRYGHGILDLAGALALAAGEPLAQEPAVRARRGPAPKPPAPSFWRRQYLRLRIWLLGARPR